MEEQKNNYIPFNKPIVTGTEENLISKVINNGTFGGNNYYTEKCHDFFRNNYGFKNSFLTHSCSLALEIAAILCDLSPRDEVIIPSYAYVTDASSFVKTGAKVVFADSEETSPNISPISIREKINSKTKVLVIVHYASIACDMSEILNIVEEFNLILVEDCAQGIHAKYKNKFLGSFGHISTFSFHETKNIQCGEGGLLVINDLGLLEKSSQIWNEGTNKKDFIDGKVSSYEWTTLGSSYQPSEITAAFLYSQLTQIEKITERRKNKWQFYYKELIHLEKENKIILQKKDSNSSFNAHIFYIKLNSKNEREKLQQYLKYKKISATFHFLPLHKSNYWLNKENNDLTLTNAENWSDCLIRLPLYDSIKLTQQTIVIDSLLSFFNQKT